MATRYPQPEDDFGYREVTYDLSDRCQECGIGLRQRAPFQMSREPRWGTRGILQLNWVFDEYFARPEVWAALFEPYGVAARPVTNRRGRTLETVVQLVVAEEVDVEMAGAPSQTCASCGRVKYLPWVRGPFPRLLAPPTGNMARTRQWFGSGHRAFQSILASQALAAALTAAKVRGVAFTPAE